ncbi:MAG: B12-binding domain-containing radical SAM protein [Nitrospinae bacterium]|nr:B12-binding domain-containing radical SAM protein [Nitrospinota bacterium]
MARVLLTAPGSRTFYGEPRYPMGGISMIGAVLRKEGHDVQCVDMRFSSADDDFFDEKIKAFQPDAAGFTVTNWDVLEAVRLAGRAKVLDPKIITIFGGPQATLCPMETLDYPEADIVVRGEGEVTILSLIKAIEKNLPLEGVPGVGFRGDKGAPVLNAPPDLIKDLSSLPWPAYGLFDLPKYFAAGDRRMGIIGSRGCPFGCIFCTSHNVMGRATRYRMPDDVLAEMKHWHESQGVSHFQFMEDNFLGNRRKAMAFLDELERASLPVTYSLEVGVRADALKPDICRKLKKTGCSMAAIGIESADPEVLRLANKGEDIETITSGIRALKAAGIPVKGYFIVGLPGDTRDKVQKSVRYAVEEKIDMPRFALAQAFPHSKLAEWVAENGHFYHDPYEYTLHHTDEFHGEVHFDFPGFPREEIWKAYLWAHDQAEALSFKHALIRRFGEGLGRAANIFNTRPARKAAIWLYQHKFISLP